MSRIRGTTEAETQEREPGWLEDQKKTGQSKKESRTSSLGRGFSLAPFQVREGLVLESGMGPSLYLGAKLCSCGRGAQAGTNKPMVPGDACYF